MCACLSGIRRQQCHCSKAWRNVFHCCIYYLRTGIENRCSALEKFVIKIRPDDAFGRQMVRNLEVMERPLYLEEWHRFR